MNYPVKKVYVTQKWGVNKDVYSRFGYQGHNGVDLRLFDENGNKATTSLVFAPHDGVVKERRNDTNGYGNYLKIENGVEGSIIGHLKSFAVGINKHVKKGDLIGVGDNTGWSTGAHVHWGYYRHPRNRQNGFGGTIDPTPYIKVIEENMSNELEVCLRDRKKFWGERDKARAELEALQTTIAGYKSRITDLGNQLGESQAQADNYKEKVGRVNDELLMMVDRVELLDKQIKSMGFELEDMAKTKGLQAIELAQAKERIVTLELQQEQGEITITLAELWKLVWSQKITIKRKDASNG